MSLYNDGMGLADYKSRAYAFFIGLSCSIPTIVFYNFSLLFFLSIGWHCGAGVFGLMGCISLSLSLSLPTSFNNNNSHAESFPLYYAVRNGLHNTLGDVQINTLFINSQKFHSFHVLLVFLCKSIFLFFTGN